MKAEGLIQPIIELGPRQTPGQVLWIDMYLHKTITHPRLTLYGS